MYVCDPAVRQGEGGDDSSSDADQDAAAQAGVDAEDSCKQRNECYVRIAHKSARLSAP